MIYIASKGFHGLIQISLNSIKKLVFEKHENIVLVFEKEMNELLEKNFLNDFDFVKQVKFFIDNSSFYNNDALFNFTISFLIEYKDSEFSYEKFSHKVKTLFASNLPIQNIVAGPIMRDYKERMAICSYKEHEQKKYLTNYKKKEFIVENTKVQIFNKEETLKIIRINDFKIKEWIIIYFANFIKVENFKFLSDHRLLNSFYNINDWINDWFEKSSLLIYENDIVIDCNKKLISEFDIVESFKNFFCNIKQKINKNEKFTLTEIFQPLINIDKTHSQRIFKTMQI